MESTVQEKFVGFLRSSFPDPPIPGSEQFNQLQMAFFAGCMEGLVTEDGEGMLVELVSWLAEYKWRNGIDARAN